MRSLIIAIVAATVGYTLSVIINSTVSAATLVGFGIDVGLGDRIHMTATEWTGLAWATSICRSTLSYTL